MNDAIMSADSPKGAMRLSPATFTAMYHRAQTDEQEAVQIMSGEDGFFFCCSPEAPRPANRMWILDADDTLWEDNLYYELLIKELYEYVSLHSTALAFPTWRAIVDRAEHQVVERLGLGPVGFRESLELAFRRFSGGGKPIPFPNEFFEAVIPALSTVPQSIDPEVPTTLAALRERGELLVLFTQGSQSIQQGKIARSGLAPLFDALCVARQKTVPTYKRLLEVLPFSASQIMAVGNSLKSDIAPAIELGLKACYFANENTWVSGNSAELDPRSYTAIHSLRELLAMS